MLLDDARHQRAAVEFLDCAAGQDQTRQVAHRFGVSLRKEIGHQFSLLEEHVTEFLIGGFGGRRLDGFHNSQQKRGSLEVVKPGIGLARRRCGDIAADPAQQLGAGSLIVYPLLDGAGMLAQQIGNLIQDLCGESIELLDQAGGRGSFEDREHALRRGRTQVVQ